MRQLNFRPAAKSTQHDFQVERFCLILAPAFLAASTFFWQNGDYGTHGRTLLIFSMFLWIPALTVIFSLVRNDLPRYATCGLWIAVFGCISGVCFAFLGYVAEVFKISHQDYLALLSRCPVSSQLLLFSSGTLFPLSLLVLGGVLFVKKSVPVWIAILFCLAAVCFPLGRIYRAEWLGHLTDVLLLIPCVSVGLKYQSLGNEKLKLIQFSNQPFY